MPTLQTTSALNSKIPAAPENFAIAATLTSQHVPCAMTAVYSPAQAYLAAQTGALYAAPYVNRMTCLLGDGLSIVSKMWAVLDATKAKGRCQPQVG